MKTLYSSLRPCKYRVIAHDVTAAILMFENNETDPVLTLVPDYKDSILYSGTGTVPKF